MNQAKRLRQQLGSGYCYKRFYTAQELAALPKAVSGVLAASLTAGCLRLDAVAAQSADGVTISYELLVRQPGYDDWICFDSPELPAKPKEAAMAAVLERLRKKHGLSYTDCRFPELPGKKK